MDFQFVSHSDFVSESAFVRGFARELWCQREMREMIIPEIQSQIKSLKQIGVEYTFTLDFFPRTGKIADLFPKTYLRGNKSAYVINSRVSRHVECVVLLTKTHN